MTWNYRLMEWEKDGERWRTFHPVYYDDAGNLVAYAAEPSYPMAVGDDDMASELAKFTEAMEKPTLVAEQFPTPPERE